jgi:hypothetical protein
VYREDGYSAHAADGIAWCHLLPLLGLLAATLLRVERRALPASATRLDPVVRVRSPQGQDYLHIVAWQGYPDRTVR